MLDQSELVFSLRGMSRMDLKMSRLELGGQTGQLLKQYSEKHIKVSNSHDLKHTETFEGLEGSAGKNREIGMDPRSIREVKIGMI